MIKEQTKKSFGQIINSVYPFYGQNPQGIMKVRKPITVIGAMIIVSGIVFHLQGQSIVGPESSFMYSNPEWITYGSEILILGIAVVAIGIGLSILKKLS